MFVSKGLICSRRCDDAFHGGGAESWSKMRLLAGIEMQNDLDGSLGMSPLREGGG